MFLDLFFIPMPTFILLPPICLQHTEDMQNQTGDQHHKIACDHQSHPNQSLDSFAPAHLSPSGNQKAQKRCCAWVHGCGSGHGVWVWCCIKSNSGFSTFQALSNTPPIPGKSRQSRVPYCGYFRKRPCWKPRWLGMGRR